METTRWGDWLPLECPSCGGQYLHHWRVSIYERAEDKPQTAVTTVDGGKTTVAVLPSDRCGNPSSRRHGLTIEFYCEMCPAKPMLTIAQHKGCTELGWCEGSDELPRMRIVDPSTFADR